MNTITFAPNADPILTAKVSGKLEKALKPSCLDCGKILSTRDLRAGRFCTDHAACRLRRILAGPRAAKLYAR